MKPLWFGPEQRPLFGWLHTPVDGYCRGGVLLAPTLGIEAVSARYAYRLLAERLTDSGFAVLRFDYDGTGDSAGRVDDPGRVAAWLESIRAAIDFVSMLGVQRLSVVGMRVGATLVAEALGSCTATIDDVVLWDPCASGRAFIREQKALWSIALGARSNDDGSIETPGFIYDKETVADLSQVLIANAKGPLADGVLLLSRWNRKGDRRMNQYLSMPHVERVSIMAQDELVDVEPGAAKIPYETIEIMLGWLINRAAAATAVAVDREGLGKSRAIMTTTPEGVAIEEQTMSLGPRGLFGIMTSRRDDDAESGLSTLGDRTANPETESPTVFLLNAGPTDHAGPARLWVQLSRMWAAEGVRVVRFDLTGLGDSPLRTGERGPIIYARDALDDVLDVLQAVSPEDPSNAVLVGLCSGGYHAVEAALMRKVRGICIVNPILTIRLAEVDSEGFAEGNAEPRAARRSSFGARRGIARRSLPAHEIMSPLVQNLPNAAWWVINRIVVALPPARLLSRVVDAGVDVLVVAGEKEARLLSRGQGRTMRRLQHNKQFQMKIIPELEHSLFERHGRELVGEMLTTFVVSHCGSTATHQIQGCDGLG